MSKKAAAQPDSGRSRETLGQRIQRLRVEAGLTQRQLAEKAGVTVRALQSWEIDHRRPSLDQAWKIAAALDVELSSWSDTIREEPDKRKPRPAGPTKRLSSGEE